MAHGPEGAGHEGAGHEGAGHDDAHAHHPTAKTYLWTALFLTIVTIIEISAFYIKPWEQSAIYVPSMIFMSGVKFAVVCAVYMHLKYDHKLFRNLFVGPLTIAIVTLTGLLFLFGKVGINLGLTG
jgi:cytochrome c oxidase subunit IV